MLPVVPENEPEDIWTLEYPSGNKLPPGSYSVLDTGALAAVTGTEAGEVHYEHLPASELEGVTVGPSNATFQGISAKVEQSRAKIGWNLGIAGHKVAVKTELLWQEFLSYFLCR